MSDAPPDWTTRTASERLAEVERLRRERHGAALDAPMVTIFRVVDLRTGRVLSEGGDGSPRRRSGTSETSL